MKSNLSLDKGNVFGFISSDQPLRYLNIISSNNRNPYSVVCYEYKHKEYTTLYVVVDSEEFDKYLDTY